MATPPKLTYFPLPGRVLATRIFMHQAFGTDWTDERIVFSDWKDLKASHP